MISWEYIAGFFDGEGTIGHTSRYAYKVSFSQSTMPVLEAIKEFLGGYSIYTWCATYKNKNRKYNESYQLQFSASSGVKLFLEGILPYTIVKRMEVLEALNTIKDVRPRVDYDKLKPAIKSLLDAGLNGKEIMRLLRVGRNTINKVKKNV